MIRKEEAVKLAQNIPFMPNGVQTVVDKWQSAGLVEPDDKPVPMCSKGCANYKNQYVHLQGCENYKPKPDKKSKLQEARKYMGSDWIMDSHRDVIVAKGMADKYESVIKEYQEIAWQVEQKVKNVFYHRPDIIDLLKQITEDK